MRHRKAGCKLKHNVSARRALLRGLVTSVIEEERITATIPKVKAAKPLVERMITLDREDTPHTRSQAAAFLLKPEAVTKLFDKIVRASTNAQAATAASSNSVGAKAMALNG